MSADGSRNNSYEMDLPIVYMPRIPNPQLYRAAVEFACMPGVTQQEYERAVLNREMPEDELISVTSTTVTDGIGRTLKIKTSSLNRSPFFHGYFTMSEAYLYGCKIQLTFEDNLAECLEMVRDYLDKGPDRYTKDFIQVYLLLNCTEKATRLVVLVKLYGLAGKLSLPVLKNITYESIERLGRIKATMVCTTLAPLIYDKKTRSDKKLRKWCFEQISHHFQTLKGSEEWVRVMETLLPELGLKWRDLVRNNGSLETAALDDAPPAAIEHMIDNLPASSQESLVSSMEGRFKNMVAEEVIRQIMIEKSNKATAAAAAKKAAAVAEEAAVAAEAAAAAAVSGNWDEMHKMRKKSEDSWEDFESMASGRSGLFVSSKARDILGMGDRGTPRTRPNNAGESSASATSTPTKSRGWPFSMGRDENKAKEEPGPESGSGSGTGSAWVPKLRKSKSRVEVASEPESGSGTGGDRVSHLRKSKSRMEIGSGTESGIGDWVPKLRKTKSKVGMGLGGGFGSSGGIPSPQLRKRKSGFMRMFSS